jgi:hypothetical protein
MHKHAPKYCEPHIAFHFLLPLFFFLRETLVGANNGRERKKI